MKHKSLSKTTKKYKSQKSNQKRKKKNQSTHKNQSTVTKQQQQTSYIWKIYILDIDIWKTYIFLTSEQQKEEAEDKKNQPQA